MSNEKEFVITEDKQGLWISSPDVEMADIKHNIHPKGPTYHFVKMLQSEIASLKERVRELEEGIRALEKFFVEGKQPNVPFAKEIIKTLLSNDQPQKLKEGTGSENPTVQMHRDFQKRIGR